MLVVLSIIHCSDCPDSKPHFSYWVSGFKTAFGTETYSQSPHLVDVGVFTAPSGGDVAWYLHGPKDKEIADLVVIGNNSGGPGDSTTREDSHYENLVPALETEQAYALFIDPSGSGESQPLFGDKDPRTGERHMPTSENLAEDALALLGHLGVKRYAVIGGSHGTLVNSLVVLTEAERQLSQPESGLWLPEWVVDWGVTNGDPQSNQEQHARGSNLEVESPEAFELFMSQIPEEMQNDGAAVLQYMHDTVFPTEETPENMEKAKRMIGAWGSLRYVLAYHGEERKAVAQNIAGMDPLQIFEFGEDTGMQPLNYGRNAIHHMYMTNRSPLNVVQRFRNLPVSHKPTRHIFAAENDPLTPPDGPDGATELSKAYGNNATLETIGDEGHNRAGAVVGPEIQQKVVELVMQNA